MRWMVTIIAIAAVAALVVHFLRGRSPEAAASHPEPDRLGSDRFYGDNQAPAGPDAEQQTGPRDDEPLLGESRPGEPRPGDPASGPWIP